MPIPGKTKDNEHLNTRLSNNQLFGNKSSPVCKFCLLFDTFELVLTVISLDKNLFISLMFQTNIEISFQMVIFFQIWPGMQSSCLRSILKFYLEKQEQDCTYISAY
jgi:hypothetical protein